MSGLPEVLCRVCGEPAVEIMLCQEHFHEYHEWKRLDGDNTSFNRVNEFIDLLDEIAGLM
jgi:hypothetical protein